MVLPFILGAVAIGAGLVGVSEGVDAASDNEKAKQIEEEALERYKRRQDRLEYLRQNTTESLEELGKLKLDVWNQQLGRFVQLYEQLRNVELTGQANVGKLGAATFTKEDLKQMRDLSIKAHEVVMGGTGALGSGALVGMASYGGAVMFASASTGTAISSLAGVAATNATLAWFGGGSLAAGGLGMAGGMAVLGGIVVGPVLAVGGMMMASQARKKLANAKKNRAESKKVVEEINNAISVLEAINDVAREFDEVIQQLSKMITPVLDTLESTIQISGTDYSRYNLSQKRQVHLTVQFAQTLKIVLETPLLTKEGTINNQCFETLKQVKQILQP